MFCDKCHITFPENALFCSTCGGKLLNNISPDTSGEEDYIFEPPKSKWLKKIEYADTKKFCPICGQKMGFLSGWSFTESRISICHACLEEIENTVNGRDNVVRNNFKIDRFKYESYEKFLRDCTCKLCGDIKLKSPQNETEAMVELLPLCNECREKYPKFFAKIIMSGREIEHDYSLNRKLLAYSDICDHNEELFNPNIVFNEQLAFDNDNKIIKLVDHINKTRLFIDYKDISRISFKAVNLYIERNFAANTISAPQMYGMTFDELVPYYSSIGDAEFQNKKNGLPMNYLFNSDNLVTTFNLGFSSNNDELVVEIFLHGIDRVFEFKIINLCDYDHEQFVPPDVFDFKQGAIDVQDEDYTIPLTAGAITIDLLGSMIDLAKDHNAQKYNEYIKKTGVCKPLYSYNRVMKMIENIVKDMR